MKTIQYLICCLLTFSVFAEPLPKKPCEGIPLRSCTQFMTDVYRDFIQAEDLIKELTPGVYSGSCHYLARDYGSEHEHFAGLYIDEKDNQLYFNGRFSFFANPNPYTDWDLETVKTIFKDPYRFPLKSYGDHSLADYSPDGGIWKFWMAQDAASSEILLISYWGFFQRGFCRFSRNH